MAHYSRQANDGADGAQYFSCLLVGNDSTPAQRLAGHLRAAGMGVVQRTGMQSWAAALSDDFDIRLVLCDASQPSAEEAVRSIAERGLAVVAVLEMATPDAVSRLLEAGADACLQLDAEARVAVAQVRAVLRRYGGQVHGSEPPIVLGHLEIDLGRFVATRAGEPVPLTTAEFRVLAHMAQRSAEVLSPVEVIEATHPGHRYSDTAASDILRVYVKRIRAKMEPDPSQPVHIITVRGRGYRLEGGTAATSNRPKSNTG